jgi:hypothetical protein
MSAEAAHIIHAFSQFEEAIDELLEAVALYAVPVTRAQLRRVMRDIVDEHIERDFDARLALLYSDGV